MSVCMYGYRCVCVYIHVVRYVYIVWLYGCMRAHAHTEIFYLLYFIILYILPYIYMFWYGGRYLMELLCMYSFVYLRVRTFIYILGICMSLLASYICTVG